MDISGAAERWMRYTHASYVVPQHSFTARRPEGAFFLYGSMDEALAAPALFKIASDPAHPQRELALSLLGKLATSEADDAFRSVDLSGFPSRVQTAARSELANRPVFKRRDPPKSTREEILAVLRSIVDQRDFGPFMELIDKVPDGERDVVTVMKPADLLLIRKARRAMAASGNPHLMGNYPFFTGIIWTLQQRH
jgi:HEAT repeat protein